MFPGTDICSCWVMKSCWVVVGRPKKHELDSSKVEVEQDTEDRTQEHSSFSLDGLNSQRRRLFSVFFYPIAVTVASPGARSSCHIRVFRHDSAWNTRKPLEWRTGRHSRVSPPTHGRRARWPRSDVAHDMPWLAPIYLQEFKLLSTAKLHGQLVTKLKYPTVVAE